MKQADVVIIGGGAGGLTVAYTARGFGKSVLMIDRNKPGGECTWSGCIPSKALINQANDIYTAKKYGDIVVDTKQVMAQVRDVISTVYAAESVDVLAKDGIAFVKGTARFTGPKTLEVDGETITGKKVFVCTGSAPMIPPINGVDQVDILTNENVFELEELPSSLLVLGAGAIGVELAQAMNRLGVTITLVEMANQILPREDEELVQILTQQLISEGIQIYTGTKAVSLGRTDQTVLLEVEQNGQKITLEAEKILFALGRKPNVDGLDLKLGGIDYDAKGIKVNANMETTSKGVFAVGDVIGRYMFSHMANVEGIRAAQNAILPIKRPLKDDHVVWCTYTSPEFATAGMTESQAREKYGQSIRVYRHDYAKIDRSKTKPGHVGQVKLILSKSGKVLGCSILGERAGELICEVQTIKTLNQNFGKLAGVIHPYPTYSEVLNKIGKKVLVDNIWHLPIISLFKK